jgi:hypothetical protein
MITCHYAITGISEQDPEDHASLIAHGLIAINPA